MGTEMKLEQVRRPSDLESFLGRTDIKMRFQELLGNRLSVQRFYRTLLFSVKKQSDLMNRPKDLFTAALALASWGLECNPITGEAYIVPFKGIPQPIVGYKGYHVLAFRCGWTINSYVVLEGEAFAFHAGTSPSISHEILLNGPETICGAYAVATHNKTGALLCARPVNRATLEGMRQRFGAKAGSAWRTSFEAMCRKTAVRRIFPQIPVDTATSEAQQFHAAFSADCEREDELQPDAEFQAEELVVEPESVSVKPPPPPLPDETLSPRFTAPDIPPSAAPAPEPAPEPSSPPGNKWFCLLQTIAETKGKREDEILNAVYEVTGAEGEAALQASVTEGNYRQILQRL